MPAVGWQRHPQPLAKSQARAEEVVCLCAGAAGAAATPGHHVALGYRDLAGATIVIYCCLSLHTIHVAFRASVHINMIIPHSAYV